MAIETPIQNKKIHYIYKIINTINNKIYIGQSIEYKRRWAAHKRDAVKNSDKASLASFAIKKYGEKYFIFEILACCQTMDDANEIESYLIRYYNSQVPNGYNITSGGSNGFKSEESKELMRNYWRDPIWKNWVISLINNYHQNCSIGQKEKRRENMSKLWKENHFSFDTEFKKGHKHSEEVLKKLSTSNSGKTAWNKGTVGVMKVNSASFKKGHVSWLKGTHITTSSSFITGEKHKMAKLTNEQVLEIVELHKQKVRKKDIADKFNITIANVYSIIRGRSWNHITGLPKPK